MKINKPTLGVTQWAVGISILAYIFLPKHFALSVIFTLQLAMVALIIRGAVRGWRYRRFLRELDELCATDEEPDYVYEWSTFKNPFTGVVTHCICAPEWVRKFDIKRCPECGAYLDQPGSVLVEGVDHKTHPTCLKDNGEMYLRPDESGVVKSGSGYSTFCKACGESLDIYETMGWG